MGKKVTVNLGGREIIGEKLNFKTVDEEWNVYKTEDGTIIKLKTVATEIFRADNEYTDEGDPIYHVKSSNMVVTDVPQQLKLPKKSGGDA